jgi:type III secretion protein R
VTGADAVAWLALVALVPLAGLLLSSFVKMLVVLSILRIGLGGRAIPPASVTAGLALVLTVFVMAPVGEQSWRAMSPGLRRGDAASLADAASAGSEPLREFLFRRVPERERVSFVELARRLRSSTPGAERAAVGERDLVVLGTAFVVAELRAAFQIGFLLLLPFLILDLVVASVLDALGMHALDPRAVALPFKLLLFVLADGWHLLARGLILGYS